MRIPSLEDELPQRMKMMQEWSEKRMLVILTHCNIVKGRWLIRMHKRSKVCHTLIYGWNYFYILSIEVDIVYMVPISSSEPWDSVCNSLASTMGYNDDEPFLVSYCFSNSRKSEQNSLEDNADYQGIIAFFQACRQNANPVQVIILDNNVCRFQFHINFNNRWIYSFCRQIHLRWGQVIPVRQGRK